MLRSEKDLKAAAKRKKNVMWPCKSDQTAEKPKEIAKDSVMPCVEHALVGAIQRLNNLESDEVILPGGFKHQFSGNDWRLKVISWFDNVRCTHSRIIYGDQALFIRRTLFHQLGGARSTDPRRRSLR